MQSPSENPDNLPVTDATRREVEALDSAIDSIQPGGGICMRAELAWGGLRRWYLRNFRRGYLTRMAATRCGDRSAAPFDVLDPRDTKFYRNQGGHYWKAEDDPFRWRDSLPVARVGLAEILILGGSCLLATILLAWLYWPVCWVPLLLGLFLVSFFRDPRRIVPAEAGLIVAPADGKVVEIERVDHHSDLGGPAVTIGIFLSVFNVHINRSPAATRVVALRYRPGKFLNALRAVSARENEQLEIRLEEISPPHRPIIVRQIAGAIARRIVCWIRPGEDLERGEQFGMIKLGSRTELVLSDDADLSIEVQLGQHVRAGTSIMARYATTEVPDDSS